jgi:hypothetical protein
MKPRVIKIVIGVSVVCLLLGGAALAAIVWDIHRSVQECCGIAQRAHPHPGDDVTALIDLMNSDSHSLRGRNLAIWTLGRLRESKALPALTAVYTGEQCNHDKNLCQYELEKAIKRCGGIPNPPRKTRH